MHRVLSPHRAGKMTHRCPYDLALFSWSHLSRAHFGQVVGQGVVLACDFYSSNNGPEKGARFFSTTIRALG